MDITRWRPSSPTHLNLRVAELAKSFGVSRCWPKALAASATVHPKTKLRRNTSSPTILELLFPELAIVLSAARGVVLLAAPAISVALRVVWHIQRRLKVLERFPFLRLPYRSLAAGLFLDHDANLPDGHSHVFRERHSSSTASLPRSCEIESAWGQLCHTFGTETLALPSFWF